LNELESVQAVFFPNLGFYFLASRQQTDRCQLVGARKLPPIQLNMNI